MAEDEETAGAQTASPEADVSKLVNHGETVREESRYPFTYLLLVCRSNFDSAKSMTTTLHNPLGDLGVFLGTNHQILFVV